MKEHTVVEDSASHIVSSTVLVRCVFPHRFSQGVFMAFRKKRSQYFWVFSSYSLVLHLAGILALLILISHPSQETDSPPIPIRLVDALPIPPEIPTLPKVSTAPQTETPPPSQPNTVSQAQPVRDLFRVIPPTHTPRRTETESNTPPPTHPFVQVAINSLQSPPEVTPSRLRGPRPLNPTARPTRILMDHQTRSSLTGSTPPKVLYKPVPQYPKIARELGLEGKTLLRVEILQDGRLGVIKVRESCGHTVLDEAATKAIKKWKFAPAHDGQFTVRSVVDLPIRFSLKSLG